MTSIDSQDKAILNLIQIDATLSVGDIAEKVNISKSACWRRLQKLEKEGVILQRVALLDQKKIDLPLTAYISVCTNQHNEDWIQELQRVTESIPAILEVYRMSGDLDYLIKAVMKDMPDYDRLYKKLIKANFSDVSCSFVMETVKQTTRLPL
jgi:Lrp/AsnC family transcriptional regulator